MKINVDYYIDVYGYYSSKNEREDVVDSSLFYQVDYCCINCKADKIEVAIRKGLKAPSKLEGKCPNCEVENVLERN